MQYKTLVYTHKNTVVSYRPWNPFLPLPFARAPRSYPACTHTHALTDITYAEYLLPPVSRQERGVVVFKFLQSKLTSVRASSCTGPRLLVCIHTAGSTCTSSINADSLAFKNRVNRLHDRWTTSWLGARSYFFPSPYRGVSVGMSGKQVRFSQ